jgi:hypothetical protein
LGGRSSGSFSASDIQVLATGLTAPISDPGHPAYNAAASESGVAYTQTRADGRRDIVHFDTGSGAYTILRSDVQGGASIDMFGSMVVWEGFRTAPGGVQTREIFWAARHDDSDSVPSALDDCPYYANPDQKDTDQDGRGDACECGDQNGDGRVNVADLVSINLAIFNPGLVTPLCDTNNDGLCNVADIIGANTAIFVPRTSTCARQPVPGP